MPDFAPSIPPPVPNVLVASDLPPPPGAAAIADLLEKLKTIPEPRALPRVQHQLIDVLLCALFAMMSDCADYCDMALFAETQLDWLRRYVPLRNGAPSHDTFRYVFMLIKPAAFTQIMSEWVGSLENRHVRIDGKVNRGVKNTETGRSRFHLLRAWISELGLSAGQAVCSEKSNELSTLPGLLAQLELKGAVVTIDAMAGHPEIAQQLSEAGADYILALKANEKETLATVSAHFRTLSGQLEHPPAGVKPAATLHPPETMPCHWPATCDVILTEEKNRGRYEERTVITTAVGDWWPKSFLWYGVKSVICVIRRTLRQRHDTDFPKFEVHYYVSSLPAAAARVGPLIRGHWAIENGCHHTLDVTFGEDHSQVRDVTAAHNLTNLRELALKLLKAHPGKGSVKARRKRAALSKKFRDELVAPLFAHSDT